MTGRHTSMVTLRMALALWTAAIVLSITAEPAVALGGAAGIAIGMIRAECALTFRLAMTLAGAALVFALSAEATLALFVAAGIAGGFWLGGLMEPSEEGARW